MMPHTGELDPRRELTPEEQRRLREYERATKPTGIGERIGEFIGGIFAVFFAISIIFFIVGFVMNVGYWIIKEVNRDGHWAIQETGLFGPTIEDVKTALKRDLQVENVDKVHVYFPRRNDSVKQGTELFPVKVTDHQGREVEMYFYKDDFRDWKIILGNILTEDYIAK